MKKEDLFKSMSELDNDLIAEAGEEGAEIKPAYAAESKKRFNIRPFAAAAACCALLAGVAAVTGKSFRNNIEAFLPQDTEISTENNAEDKAETDKTTDIYPESAKYRYTGDYSEFEEFVGPVCIEFASYYSTYSELLNACDVAVVGKFIDDPWQNIDPKALASTCSERGHSFNCLEVEKVLSPNCEVKAGERLVINQNYAIAKDGILSDSKLTPMLNGDRWVYFLTYNDSNGTYYPLNDYNGRFPVPDNSTEGNKFLPAMDNKYGLIDSRDFDKDIYNTLKEILDPASIPAVKCIYDGNNLEMYNRIAFELAEFENVVFSLRNGVLYVDRPWSSENKNGMEITSLSHIVNKIYLTDLNEDEKREICLQMRPNEETPFEYILIWDYANQKMYEAVGEAGKTEFYLGESDGVLLAYKTQCNSDGSRGEVISDEELSLYMKDEFCVSVIDTEHHGHSEYCLQDTEYCMQQSGECPYRHDSNQNDGQQGEHHGHCEYCLQDTEYCMQQSGECPYRHDSNQNVGQQGEHHGHSEYCLQDTEYCLRQSGECPYRHDSNQGDGQQGEHHGEHHGHSEYCLQDTEYCLQQSGECPYRHDSNQGDGQQGEHHGEHHGHCEYCLQDTEYCLQQSGECPYRHDSNQNDEQQGEHHGHSEYCLQDTEYCLQQSGACPYRKNGHHGNGQSSSSVNTDQSVSSNGGYGHHGAHH